MGAFTIADGLARENKELEGALKAAHSELRISNLLVDKLETQKSLKKQNNDCSPLGDIDSQAHLLSSRRSIKD